MLRRPSGILFFLLMLASLGIRIHAETNLPDFFSNAYNKFAPQIQARFENKYLSFCQERGLQKDHQDNLRWFSFIEFYHALFTTVAARDGATGGILKIPYFWHWVNPNPRHDITYLPISMSLAKVGPPKGFEKYKSYADADRLPSLYLADLVTDKPKFRHRLCGDFYTFGWCSEREMAFNALLTLQGFSYKLKQDGIHTWSEVLVNLVTIAGKSQVFVAKVDNTFDQIEWEPLRQSKTEWQRDFGTGSQVKWYNATAHSPEQSKAVKNILVSKKAAKRIEIQVKEWLSGL